MSEMPQVIVLDTGYDSYEYERQALEKAGYDLVLYDGPTHDRNAKIAFCRAARAIFIRATVIDEEFLEANPDLCFIVRYGVGYDNVDLEAAKRYGIRVANVQAYANHSVSEHALALMFACSRALGCANEINTPFGCPPRQHMFEFNDKTLGIIGLGRIGGTLALKGRTLFQRILAYDPYISSARFAQLGVEQSDFIALIEASHVISLHCNLTGETRGMIDHRAFSHMLKRPILVNTARGPIVVEDALLSAISSGQIHSAGLDVFCEEPLSHSSPLRNHPRIILTGHYAWYSDEASQRLQQRATDHMITFLKGQIPEDCLV